MGQWILNVFHAGVQPSEIFKLKYHDLAYFSEMHGIIQGEYKRQVDEANKPKAGH
jgi:hypothetical protein